MSNGVTSATEASRTPEGHPAPRVDTGFRRLERVLSVMRSHPEQTHTTRSLANIAAVSPYHFNRIFRRATGLPPAQYLCALRIEAAKRLLLTTSLHVTDICFDVGYSSLGTFVTRFTQLVGLSPRALRQAAENFRPDHMRRVGELIQDRRSREGFPPVLLAHIDAPPDFEGVIFVGVFHTLMPHAAPVRCQILDGPGVFELQNVPAGTYYIAAAGFPWEADISHLLLDCVLRGSYGPIVVSHAVNVLPDFPIRKPSLEDPPILAAFPLLWVTQQ